MILCGYTHTIQDNLTAIKMQAINIKKQQPFDYCRMSILRVGIPTVLNPYIYSKFHRRKTLL
jgi:hypothetical protein